MKLWVDTKEGSPGRAVAAKVKEQVEGVNRQVVSRGTRAVNAIRNAELDVLKGQRSGRVYRKYPFKSKYTASAPGEPPARRSGNLRLHWNGQVKTSAPVSGNGVLVSAELESQERYAAYLEHGTRKMAPRPFVERIKEKAEPEIRRIYSESYK